MYIDWEPSLNFSAGRAGRKVIAIVDHITAGAYPGCREWMQNTASKASAHYVVSRAGTIDQLVREGDTAWHAGIVNRPNWSLYDGTNPNRYTIGIEHEGQPGEELTEEQYQATLWLHKDLIRKYGIPIDRDHIIGHYRVDSVNRPNCPGSGFPWDRLFRDLKGDGDVLEVAVLLNTKEDYWAGADVAAKNGNCAVFVRGVDKSVPKDAMAAKRLIVVGGSTAEHANEVLLSGKTKFDTAAVVGKYLG